MLRYHRAIRMDRVVQASTEFINRVLGRKFLRDDPPDLSTALKQSSYPTPIVLFFTNGEVKFKNQTFIILAVLRRSV